MDETDQCRLIQITATGSVTDLNQAALQQRRYSSIKTETLHNLSPIRKLQHGRTIAFDERKADPRRT